MCLWLFCLCCVVDQINESACCMDGTILVKKLQEKMIYSSHPSKTNIDDAKKCTNWNLSCFFTLFAMMGQYWRWETIAGAKSKSWQKNVIYNFHHALPGPFASLIWSSQWGNWMTIILLMVLKMMRIKKPKKVTWILCSEYKPPSPSACTSAIINPLISCNKAGDN